MFDYIIRSLKFNVILLIVNNKIDYYNWNLNDTLILPPVLVSIVEHILDLYLGWISPSNPCSLYSVYLYRL